MLADAGMLKLWLACVLQSSPLLRWNRAQTEPWPKGAVSRPTRKTAPSGHRSVGIRVLAWQAGDLPHSAGCWRLYW
jgi:hypothetical protein